MKSAVFTVPTILEVLSREMRLRNYSPKTIKSYRSCIRELIRYLAPTHPRQVTTEPLKGFLLYLMEERGFAASSINQVINAIRFLFAELYLRPFHLGEIPRPRREKRLQVVLSEDEVGRILDSTENIKHRTILMVINSAGLRLGESVRLRPEDIDRERRLIHLRSAKGGEGPLHAAVGCSIERDR